MIIYFIKVKEKIDIYDSLNNLNPFKIKVNYPEAANKFIENYVDLLNRNK